MIPFGPVYKDLRSKMLGIYSDDRISSEGTTNLATWIEESTFTVSAISADRFSVIAARLDFTSALMRDVELLVDSCFEQLLDISITGSDNNRSPAWGVVTSYYYAYYSGQALTRILGIPTIYLDDEKVKSIKILSGSPTNLGAGVFVLENASEVSATHSEYTFNKSKQRPHDAVWKSLVATLRNVHNNHPLRTLRDDTQAVAEFQLFDMLTSRLPGKCFPKNGDSWPAEVRYEANYRVGNAYTMLRRSWHLGSPSCMTRWNNTTTEQIIRHLRPSLNDFGEEDGTNGIKKRASWMLHFANLLFALVRQLQLDLKSRRKTDPRWETRRKTFVGKHATLKANTGWLFPTVE